MKVWTTESEAATIEAGRELGAELKEGDVVGLVGTLGMGKTHFVKGIARGLGSEAEVGSPTFGLVHELPVRLGTLFHFDFYRLETEGDVFRIGWEEYLAEPGVVVVEWADRFPDLFPDGARWFFFTGKADSPTRSRRIEERQGPHASIEP